MTECPRVPGSCASSGPGPEPTRAAPAPSRVCSVVREAAAAVRSTVPSGPGRMQTPRWRAEERGPGQGPGVGWAEGVCGCKWRPQGRRWAGDVGGAACDGVGACRRPATHVSSWPLSKSSAPIQ